MDRNQQLIQGLADGLWHSGESLARLLGVSRAAVWKRLQGLEELGLEVESRHGKGYRFRQSLELLHLEAIRQGLTAESRLQDLRLMPSIDSTNTWLMQQDSAPAAVFAEYQRAGRGRRGRNWVSPFGANLYFSLAWRFDAIPPQLPALSLAIGVVLAETLGLGGIGLKWPNDLLWQGRKLAGILIEHRGEAAGPCRVVIGVGLNHSMTARQGVAVEQDWVSLEEVCGMEGRALPGRNELAGRLLNALLDGLEQFAGTGFDGFHDRWSAYDVSRNKPVRLLQDKADVQGVAQGVDRNGALLVQVRGERQRFFSGEISLRVQA